MDAAMSVFGWVTDNEGFFSGLVAIVALLGVAGAVARLLWVRARRLGPSAATGWQGWAIGVGCLAAIAALILVVLSSSHGESDRGHVDRTGPPTIAVLPFTTMSGAEEHEWMSDGLTEDIITLLARSPGMQIIARHSTFQYKGQSVDIRQVGEELGADFVVEGSLRPIGDRIRVTVQLIDASSGTHVWAEKYDRPLSDLFALQDEVASGIAAGVGDEVFKIESIRATQAHADNLDAWGQTWRADASWSVEDARKAVLLDENYGRSHAVLGRNLSLSVLQSSRDPVAFAEAVRAARRGAELAPGDPIVLTHLGVTLLWSGEPEQALMLLERVPSMSPSYAEGFAWYGDALIHNGRPEEGLNLVNRAIDLTPNARIIWVYEIIRAEALIHLGRFDVARVALRHAQLKGTFPLNFAYLAGVEALTGNRPEARRLMVNAKAVAPDFTAAGFRQMYNFYSIDNGGTNFERMFDALEAAIR